MDTSKMRELKTLAEALIGLNKANSWDWVATVEDARMGKTHAEFSLAASPATILALLDEIEALQGLYRMHQQTEAREMRDVKAERDQLKAEGEALRKDAERYRFVSKLAWYVDRAAQVYGLCNVNSNWRTERGSPDEDEVEEAIDATMAKVASHG